MRFAIPRRLVPLALLLAPAAALGQEEPAAAPEATPAPEAAEPTAPPEEAPAEPAAPAATPAPAPSAPAEEAATPAAPREDLPWQEPPPAQAEAAEEEEAEAAEEEEVFLWPEGQSAPEEEEDEFSEEGLVPYWPLVATLGVGDGWAFEGTTNTRGAALTIQPAVSVGFWRHWKIDHGPTLALPVGLPLFDYDLNLAVVPGYRGIHRVMPEFFYGIDVGFPIVVMPNFLPGIEISGMAAYRIWAGLGAFARISVDAFFCVDNPACYSLTTLGGEIGIVLYYEWFHGWEPAEPASAEPPAAGPAVAAAPWAATAGSEVTP